jgi:hypothetical protein
VCNFFGSQTGNPVISYALMGFWGIVVFAGIINRLFAAAVQHNTRGIYQDPEASSNQRIKPRFGATQRWIRRHIVLPAVFGYRHQQPLGWCTIPTRIQSLMLLSFIAVNVILSSVNYRAFENNILCVVQLLILDLRSRNMTSDA